VCLKGLPEDVFAPDLHKTLEEDANMKVKSLKISLDIDYKSNKYGFVTF
jgi:hypothetical protein